MKKSPKFKHVAALVLAIFAAVALATITSSCKSTGGSSDPVAEIGFWTRTAAAVGTQEALIEHPEYRPKFIAATNTLTAVTTTNGVDILVLRQVLKDIGVNELKSREARIAITLATVSFQRYGRDLNVTNSNKHVAAAIGGVLAGISDGLAATQ